MFNHSCLHYAILKNDAISTEEEATRQEIVNLKMFKMGFVRSSKCSKTTWNSSEQPIELTQNLATETTAPQSWQSYVVTIIGHYYAVIVEGL